MDNYNTRDFSRPKYCEGDIVSLDKNNLGQVYTTYKDFFKTYQIPLNGYNRNNDITDYKNKRFVIKYIAPHTGSGIPLYVIYNKEYNVTFLVSERAIDEVINIDVFNDYSNVTYTLLKNLSDKFTRLEREHKRLVAKNAMLKKELESEY